MIRDAFEQHPIHAEMTRAQRTIRDEIANQPHEGGALSFLDAAGDAISFASRSLSIQDPHLVQRTIVDQMHSTASEVIAAISAYTGSRTLADAEQVNAQAERLIPFANSMPRRLPESWFRAATPVIAEIEAAAREAKAALKTDVEATTAALKNELDATTTALENEVATTTNSLVEQATAAAQNLTDRETAATTAVAAANTSYQSALTDIQSARDQLAAATASFTATTSALETQRAAALTQINEAFTGIEGRYNTAEKARTDSFAALVNKAQVEMDDWLKKLSEAEAQAEKVLTLAGGAALSGRWIRQAKDQRLERYAWIGAIVLLAGVVFAVGWSHLDKFTAPKEYDFTHALIYYVPRLPFAIITVSLFGFAIQQAARRATWEARDRRVANELTAFPSFVATLPPDDADGFRADVARRYFPGPEMTHDELGEVEETATRGLVDKYGSLAGSLTGTFVMALILLYALSKT